jgi:hypothetical protein
MFTHLDTLYELKQRGKENNKQANRQTKRKNNKQKQNTGKYRRKLGEEYIKLTTTTTKRKKKKCLYTVVAIAASLRSMYNI